MHSKSHKYLRVITNLDLLLLLGVIIASSVTETYICEKEPFEIPYLQSIIQSMSETLSQDQNLNQTNSTEGFTPQDTLWDYREQLLENASEHGPEAYHGLFISMWSVLVAYFVLEIWLFCILHKAISQKRLTFFRKWLLWRFLLLVVTTSLVGYDIIRYQLTCTGLFVLKLCVFRSLHFLYVLFFITQLKKSASSESIVMVGSEKL